MWETNHIRKLTQHLFVQPEHVVAGMMACWAEDPARQGGTLAADMDKLVSFTNRTKDPGRTPLIDVKSKFRLVRLTNAPIWGGIVPESPPLHSVKEHWAEPDRSSFCKLIKFTMVPGRVPSSFWFFKLRSVSATSAPNSFGIEPLMPPLWLDITLFMLLKVKLLSLTNAPMVEEIVPEGRRGGDAGEENVSGSIS